MLSSGTFWLLKLTEMTSNQESVFYRHTENISLDFEPNRYYLMKINRNSQSMARLYIKIKFSNDKIYCNFYHRVPNTINM